MPVIRFNDARTFAEQAVPLLMQREAENNLIIGRSRMLAQKGLADGALLLAVKDGGDCVAAAMMTPPHRLVLSDGPSGAVEELARWLFENRLPLPGVCGPVDAAERFVGAWGALTRAEARVHRSLRIFQLDHVIAPRDAGGSFHPATSDDIPLIQDWSQAFAESIGEIGPDVREVARQRVLDGHFFLWRDPLPVSMAACAGPTPNGVRINAVYTPGELRNRGYASSCVAALSRHLLDSGRKFCFLYTDLANPTSNSIYQKIGYRAVCDWVDFILLPLPLAEGRGEGL